MTNEQIIIDKVNVSGCEYLYTDSTYNDKCCSASIGGDSLCKPSEMMCVKYVEYLKEQLKRVEQKLAYIKEYFKPKVMMNGTANVILQIIEDKANE